jgi:hypothetical protein
MPTFRTGAGVTVTTVTTLWAGQSKNMGKVFLFYKVCKTPLGSILPDIQRASGIPPFVFTFSTTFLILRRTERDMIINVYRSSCKVPSIIVRFSRTLNFLERLSKNTQLSSFMKIRPVGAELFHADGQTDRQTMTKLTDAFRSFFYASKKK